MKKVLFSLLALLVLAFGGLGAAAFLGHGPLAPYFVRHEPASLSPTPPAEVKPRDVTLGTFIIPIIQNHQIRRQIGLDLGLEVDAAANDKAAAQLTVIQNAYLVRLYELVPRHPDAHSTLDRQIIHDELFKVAAHILGEGAVRDVVVKSMYDR